MQKSIKICSVAEGLSLPVFLKSLEKAQRSSSLVELRADFIKGIKPEDVKTLKSKTKGTSIFTCRKVNEGGRYTGSYKEQKAILMAAFDAGFTYVDVAYDSPITGVLTGKQQKQLLLSYHNFKNTPASIEIIAILERMRDFSPAIMKVACMVKGSKDIFTLADVLKQQMDKEKLIVIGMGEKGRITRAMFPILGGYLTYASDSKSAGPAIMTQKELETIYEIILK